jgi:uncharacterized metal-binding protein YceD (DUF177 family)
MSGTPAEFSRPAALARLGTAPYRQTIAATAAEREELARRFGLLGLDELAAEIELVRRGRDEILLTAAFSAAFVQECVVTLEPVPGSLQASFMLVYGPPGAAPDALVDAADDAAFEPLTGDTIDVGEAVAQEFSLALPPFPRHPDARPAEPARTP